MQTQRKTNKAFHLLASLILASTPPLLHAQSAEPQAPTQAGADALEDQIMLPPFEVSAADGQESYSATTTLAGSRVRTDLKDLGTALSVVTKQFISDVGATNSQTLLQFTNNTEVGGTRGNYAGLGNSSSLNEDAALLRPNNNTRVRGLDAADNTRDYFMTEIPWDSYNVDRVEIQRGANSILFGLGSPAGIINTSLSGASFKDSAKIENRLSNYGSYRTVVDVNKALIKGQLALRIAGLDDNTKYRQKPAYNHDSRLFGALRYEPKFLRFEHASTSIRASAETGHVKANRPRMIPPVDGISTFFDVLNKQTFDSAIEDSAGGMRGQNGTSLKAATDGYLGRSYGSGLALRYNNGGTQPLSGMVGTILVDPNNGVVNGGGIGGLPFYRSMATTGYGYWAAQGNVLPGGSTGFYKDKSIIDRTAFDSINELIDGNTKREWQDWSAGNVAISETMFDNRIAIEGVIDYQHYKDGQSTLLPRSATINVDVNSTVITGLTKVGGDANPNAARAALGSSSDAYGQSFDITRTAQRLTATGDLRSTDLFEKGFLTKLLGHHVFTGLAGSEEKDTFTRQWVPFAGGIGAGSLESLLNDPSKKVNDGARTISPIIYMSGDLRKASGLSGLNMHGLSGDIIPHSGYTNVQYFDSRWNAPTVVSTAPWVNPLSPTNTYTQADNPANYVGWKTAQVRVLNADEGDIDALTYNTNRNYNRVNSQAITYQGFLWDGAFVGTFGYRKDSVIQKGAFGAKDPVSGVASLHVPYLDTPAMKNTGYSKSWSFVLHTPNEIRKKLPGQTDVSFFYNRSQNFKADVVRGDFLGNLLPNQTGRTKDYGVVVTTLEDKLSLKVNWYETSVNNANLGGESMLGNNSYFLRQGEIWGLMCAAQSIAGLTQPSIATPGWAWDYAANDLPSGTMTAGQWPRPAAAAAIDAKQLAAARAWLAAMPEQGFFDNYGYAVNVAQVKQENFASLLNSNGTMHYTWDWQPAYGGNLKSTGAGPVLTVDTVSKGVEFEVTAQLMKNWNITINAAKTDAKRQNLSKTIESYILAAKAKYDGPAGDLRLWGPNSTTIRDWGFMPNIWYPYLFLKSSENSTAPEIRPWRGNMVTTYTFDKGAIKGLYVGGGVRWMQSPILGYGMSKDAKGNYNLDVSKVYKGKDETACDLWFGYGRKLTSKVDWKVQLNLSNVGDKARFVPISVQPDGTPAAYRIADGLGWQLTNTLSF